MLLLTGGPERGPGRVTVTGNEPVCSQETRQGDRGGSPCFSGCFTGVGPFWTRKSVTFELQ